MVAARNFISVDLEEWYTSAYLREHVGGGQIEPQIMQSIAPVLSLFAKYKTTATFFTVGSVAEKHPEVISRIVEQGHEIASHTYGHTPLFKISKEEFRQEVRKTNSVLQKITGEKVIGFRAPYFSIDRKRAFGIDVLRSEGFKYDSSIFPMKTPLYGAPGAPFDPYKPSRSDIYKHDPEGKLVEYPMSVYESKLTGLKVPICGGFYGRVLPARALAHLARLQNKKGLPWNFYFHPWETYPKTPKLAVSWTNKFITYHGMSGYLRKIEHFLKHFEFTCFRDDYEKNYA